MFRQLEAEIGRQTQKYPTVDLRAAYDILIKESVDVQAAVEGADMGRLEVKLLQIAAWALRFRGVITQPYVLTQHGAARVVPMAPPAPEARVVNLGDGRSVQVLGTEEVDAEAVAALFSVDPQGPPGEQGLGSGPKLREIAAPAPATIGPDGEIEWAL